MERGQATLLLPEQRYLSRRAMCLPCLALPTGSTHAHAATRLFHTNATTAGRRAGRQAGGVKVRRLYTLVHGHLTYLSAKPYLTWSLDVSTPLIRSKPMSSSHATPFAARPSTNPSHLIGQHRLVSSEPRSFQLSPLHYRIIA